VVASVAAWRLTAPISRTVVVPWAPAGGGQLVIAGGATTGGATASGIFGLDVTRGALVEVGYLRNTLDDGAGAVMNGQVVVFGGTTGSGSASASVQAITPGLPASGAPGTVVPESALLGTLPEPRTAAAAVVVGATVYVVGGDSGTGPDPTILATTDGRQFATVATLPIPVDFPAVAALGDKLYVFGGTAATGVSAGHPVDTIQVVNLTAHTVTDSGRLPAPVTAASAVVLGGRVVIVGGETVPSSPPVRPASGGQAPGGQAPGGQAPGSTTTAAASPATPTLSTRAAVWWFDPSSGSAHVVGRLATPVAHCAVAVLGSTAWVVGGEAGGVPVAAVQSLALAASTGRPTPANTKRS
jgi:hypothetical protein